MDHDSSEADGPVDKSNEPMAIARFPEELGLPSAEESLYRDAKGAIRQEFRDTSKWKRLRCRNFSIIAFVALHLYPRRAAGVSPLFGGLTQPHRRRDRRLAPHRFVALHLYPRRAAGVSPLFGGLTQPHRRRDRRLAPHRFVALHLYPRRAAGVSPLFGGPCNGAAMLESTPMPRRAGWKPMPRADLPLRRPRKCKGYANAKRLRYGSIDAGRLAPDTSVLGTGWHDDRWEVEVEP
jgi:hypothetical protein